MDYLKCARFFLLFVLVSFLPVSSGFSQDTENDTSFSVVVLPDTQFYSEKYNDTYMAQTEWIRDNAEELNIRLAIHLGDIVQNDKERKEWEVARAAHRVLDGIVPYAVVPGNHDMGVASRDSTLFNEYFPVSDFQGNDWYGGHYGETNDSNYVFFRGGGSRFMVLSLEYEPREEVLEWANAVLQEHENDRVILVTHRYMRPSGRDEVGETVWNQVVKKHKNIFLVLCGHIGALTLQTSINDHGGTVYEMLSDYQSMDEGGQGWLRILQFEPQNNVITVSEYSPVLQKPSREIVHNYRLYYDMSETD